MSRRWPDSAFGLGSYLPRVKRPFPLWLTSLLGTGLLAISCTGAPNAASEHASGGAGSAARAAPTAAPVAAGPVAVAQQETKPKPRPKRRGASPRSPSHRWWSSPSREG